MPVRSSASWTNTFCSRNCILAHPLSCSLQTCPPEKKRKEKKRKEKKRKEKKRKEKKRKEKKRKEKKRKEKERKGKERKGKTTPFGVNLMRSQALYQASQETCPPLSTPRAVWQKRGASGTKRDQKLSFFFVFGLGADARLQTCRCALFDYNGSCTCSISLQRLHTLAAHCSCMFTMAVLYGVT